MKLDGVLQEKGKGRQEEEAFSLYHSHHQPCKPYHSQAMGLQI